MSVYFARWPDGTFSIVDAENESDAYVQLDEFGDEPAELWEMDSCLIDFELTEEGTFRLRQFGERTRRSVLERGYPRLAEVLRSEVFEEHDVEGETGQAASYTDEERRILSDAIVAEKARCEAFKRTPATTERGKDVQNVVSGSGAYVDALVNQTAANRLRKRGKEDDRKPN